MSLPIGYQCPICKKYADTPTQVKKLGKGWLRFTYGCGHVVKSRTKTIGKLSVHY